MLIEFDPEKDTVNRAKHGLSLSIAADFDLDTAVRRTDERVSYGETRYQAYGLIRCRLHVLIYTMRGDTMRVISLRKANDRERAFYDRSI